MVFGSEIVREDGRDDIKPQKLVRQGQGWLGLHVDEDVGLVELLKVLLHLVHLLLALLLPALHADGDVVVDMSEGLVLPVDVFPLLL